MAHQQPWPELPLADWEPTYRTLHRWTQVVGKVCLARTTFVNHWWNATLRVTPRGLRTPILSDGGRRFSILFDLLGHRLDVETGDGLLVRQPLEAMSVAEFYSRTLETLESLGLPVEIWPVPVEVSDTTAFPEDRAPGAYDRAAVERLHGILLQVDRVFRRHRGRFLGKSSPSHFFWGAFDLAVTRFSGRPVPEPPDDPVMGPAYSHEVISHGWWPGGDWPNGERVEEPVFYAYAVPEPDGFRGARLPAGGRYDEALGEYLFPYEAVRGADDPEGVLLEFMERTYRAGAEAGGWDPDALEVTPPRHVAG